MSLKVLVIGGYGTFGARLVRLLEDEAGLHLIVAGRSLDKAQAFVDQLQSRATVEAMALDRNADIESAFSAVAPDVVVDASGPFQAYAHDPYRVVRAALDVGAHYLDLADDPGFVIGIRRFDRGARERGLVALSGVSSCPALTGAVYRRLTRDMTTVDDVTAGIAPSPYSGVGPAVIRAIAHYAGKSIKMHRDSRPSTGYPFTETRRRTIAPYGVYPLRSLTYSLVDVPDLLLLAELDPQPANVWFGAAPVPATHHVAFRTLARLVKRGMLRSLTSIAGMMTFVMNYLSWGEHRGGMFVACRGSDDNGMPVERSWHLVAEGNIGPLTPTLACVVLIRKALHGNRPEPGARPAHRELELEDFEPLLAELGMRAGERESLPASTPLFRRILGTAMPALPEPIRTAHAVGEDLVLQGRAAIIRGRSLLSRLIGSLFRFPLAGDHVPLTVTMTSRDLRETWTRDFGGRRFSSELLAGDGRWDGLLIERFGLIRFGIALVIDGDRLHYVIRRWSIAGITMPFALRPRGDSFEFVEGGRFHFNVEIALPIVGHVVTYRGWLERA